MTSPFFPRYRFEDGTEPPKWLLWSLWACKFFTAVVGIAFVLYIFVFLAGIVQ